MKFRIAIFPDFIDNSQRGGIARPKIPEACLQPDAGFLLLEPVMRTKEQVRDWMQERAREPKPLPSQAQMNRELGRDLIEAEREEQEREAMRSVMK